MRIATHDDAVELMNRLSIQVPPEPSSAGNFPSLNSLQVEPVSSEPTDSNTSPAPEQADKPTTKFITYAPYIFKGNSIDYYSVP